MIGWLYIREGMTGNEQIGPFTDPQIAELATARKIGRDTAVAHPTKTRGQWVSAEEIPALRKIFEAAEAKRAKPKIETKTKVITTEVIENRPADLPLSIPNAPRYAPPSVPESAPVSAPYYPPQPAPSPFVPGHAPTPHTTIVVHNQAVSSSNSGDGNAAGFACLITMIILGVSLVVGVVVFFLCCGGLGLAAGS